MHVTVKLYALLSGYLPPNSEGNTANVEVADGITVMDIIRHLKLPVEHCHLVLVDGIFVPPSERESCVLRQGDAVAIWPPVAGG